ncbi:hypothetical protein [Streptomyces noursei]|uniref:hypothetical protein n=1 Tax=Streptomyces noursei TaxID=1971 RepID=UPI001965B3E4|nr:hypothetical protein [Streptomyces noursei]QRX95107.1 hypothetical protein JNO44_33640 [Streptomyces noursei]
MVPPRPGPGVRTARVIGTRSARRGAPSTPVEFPSPTPYIKPGATSRRINDIAHDLIVDKYGAEIDREDLSGYDSSAYAAISIAHNEVAFSGEPNGIPLRKGDLFGVDVSIKKNG